MKKIKTYIPAACIFLILFFSSCDTSNWHEIEIANLKYIQEANTEFIEPYKLPKIQNVSGKYKFLNREKTNSFGYVIEINIDSLSKSEALKTGSTQNDTVEVEGKKRLWGPIIGFEYKFEIQFQFYDSDGFLIYRLKSSFTAETGTKSIIQQEQAITKKEIIKSVKKVKAILYLKNYVQVVS